MKVEEAAKITGMSALYIRCGLQLGKFPFGSALNISGKRWRYHIIPCKVYEYMGLPIPAKYREVHE